MWWSWICCATMRRTLWLKRRKSCTPTFRSPSARPSSMGFTTISHVPNLSRPKTSRPMEARMHEIVDRNEEISREVLGSRSCRGVF